MSKVVFDGTNKLININTGVTSIDVETELYDAWLNWELSGSTDAAFRKVGGESIGVGQTMPTYYFLINNWKVRAENVNVNIATNLYSDDYTSPFIIVNSAVYVKNSDSPNLSTLDKIDSNLELVLGLVQQNFRFTEQTYNDNNDLTSGVINIYASSLDCDSETDPIATYLISATYDENNLLNDYKVIREEYILVDENEDIFIDENDNVFVLE